MSAVENMSLGTFEVASGKVVVSDPEYERGVWCQGVLDNVENGTWRATAIISDEGVWGKRVAALVATLGDLEPDCEMMELHSAEFEVGVDSGQAGIFDDHVFGNNACAIAPCGGYGEKWFSMCANLTISKKAGVVPGGCVSRSGFGDGGYSCLYYTDHNDQIVRIVIDFGLLDMLDMTDC